MYEESKDAHAKVVVPYVYQEYPKMLYSKSGETRTVKSEAELKAAGPDWAARPTAAALTQLSQVEPPVVSDAHKIAMATQAEIKKANLRRP